MGSGKGGRKENSGAEKWPYAVSVAETISVSEAVERVRLIADEYAASSRRMPFFLLAGAGLSAPSVPLRPELLTELEAGLRRMGHSVRGVDAMTFPELLDAAMPGTKAKRTWLKGHCHEKPLTAAHFRLANILQSGRLASQVVTSSFDTLLERALRLLGCEPLVLEHPHLADTLERQDTPQIVHLHGSWRYYHPSDTDDDALLVHLEELLSGHACMVLGYGASEADAFLKVLKRRGNARRNEVLWFVHRREEVDQLPDWLHMMTHVRIVAPTDSATLDAAEVLRRMESALSIGPPLLATDPLAHFEELNIRHLAVEEGPASDPYQLARRAEGVPVALPRGEAAAAPPAAMAEATAAQPHPFDGVMEQICEARDLVNRGVDLAEQGKSEEAIRLLSEVEDRFGGGGLEEIRESVARALINLGVAFAQTGKTDDELEAYRRATVEARRVRSIDLLQQMCLALLYRSEAARERKEYTEALESCNELETLLTENPHTELDEYLAAGRASRGWTLRAAGQEEEAVIVARKVLGMEFESTDGIGSQAVQQMKELLGIAA
jgi:tetratricopeptide (TPR) repeat protein